MSESHLKFHSTAGKRRILLIEDEAINREILGFMLQDCYDVTFAENGVKALKILETEYQTLSMVLLDLNLPDMKGIEILKNNIEKRNEYIFVSQNNVHVYSSENVKSELFDIYKKIL